MSKNFITEITKMLGVELGEEFKVVYKTGFEIICNFTKEGVFVHEEGCSGRYNKELLADIVCGKVEIVKLPWKPKQDETFYTFGIHATENKWVVVSVKWWDNVKNLALYKIGWIYRSQAEAEAALPKVAAEMGVGYEL